MFDRLFTVKLIQLCGWRLLYFSCIHDINYALHLNLISARTGSRLGKKQEVINEEILEHKKMVEHKKTSVAVKPG